MYAKNSLAALLTILSDCEVMLTRIFDAPRELVFKAHTDSLLLTVSIARLYRRSALSTHLNLKACRDILFWIRRSSKNFRMAEPS